MAALSVVNGSVPLPHRVLVGSQVVVECSKLRWHHLQSKNKQEKNVLSNEGAMGLIGKPTWLFELRNSEQGSIFIITLLLKTEELLHLRNDACHVHKGQAIPAASEWLKVTNLSVLPLMYIPAKIIKTWESERISLPPFPVRDLAPNCCHVPYLAPYIPYLAPNVPLSRPELSLFPISHPKLLK